MWGCVWQPKLNEHDDDDDDDDDDDCHHVRINAYCIRGPQMCSCIKSSGNSSSPLGLDGVTHFVEVRSYKKSQNSTLYAKPVFITD